MYSCIVTASESLLQRQPLENPPECLIQDNGTLKQRIPPQWHMIAMRYGTKNPGSLFGKNWQHKASNDPKHITQWFMQKLNIGLLLGPKSGVIDIEDDTPEGKAIVDEWLGGLCTPTYRSSKSTHRLFKYDERFLNEKAKVTLQGVEFRFGQDSAQSVIPPSWHEESQVFYQWEEGLSPEDVEPIELPDEFWAWYIANREKEVIKTSPAIPFKVSNGGDGLIDLARNYCNESIPWQTLLGKYGWSYIRNRGEAQDWRRPGKSCGLSGTLNFNGTDTLRVFTTSIAGLDPDSSYDKFAFICALEHQNDAWNAANAILPLEQVAAWKQQRDDNQSSVDLTRLLGDLAAKKEVARTNGIEPLEKETPVAAGIARSDIEKMFIEPEFPSEVLKMMPPVMRLAFDYGIAKSIKSLPEATFFGLVALFSSILGRKVTDDYGTRLTNMIVCIADSGAGKNAQRKVNAELLDLGAASVVKGNSSIGSPQGFISELSKVPNMFFQLDEIHGLFGDINNPRHLLSGFPPVWMDIYTSSDNVYRSAAVADSTRSRSVIYPSPVIYGTTTPDEFYDVLTDKMLKNGFLSRMMLFSCRKPLVRKKPSSVKPDSRIIEWIKWWHNFVPNASGNLAGAGVAIPNPLLIRKTPDADEAFEAYCDKVEAKAISDSKVGSTLWSRASEKVNKIAMIYACLDQQSYVNGTPVTTLEAVQFAKLVVNYCTRYMTFVGESRMHQNEHSKLRQRVLDKIKSGMSRADVTRKTQFCRDAHHRNMILAELMEVNAISFENGTFIKNRNEL